MTSPSEYTNRLKSIFNIPLEQSGISLSYEWETDEEAKKILSKLIIFQKELRLLKKDINSTIKLIKMNYAEEKSKIGTGFSSMFRNRAMIKLNSLKKESIRKEELSEIEPYQELIRHIDGIMIELDKLKIQVKDING